MKEQYLAAEYSYRMSCDNCGKRLQYATYDYKCRQCGGNIIGPIGRAFLKAMIQSDNDNKKGLQNE